jgi:hypothetical protein
VRTRTIRSAMRGLACLAVFGLVAGGLGASGLASATGRTADQRVADARAALVSRAGAGRHTDSLAVEMPMRTEGVQTIQDPLGDALFRQGDVISAGVDADSNGMTTAVVVVDQWQSPLLSDDWQLALTDALWDFDVDGDGASDYYALILGVDDQVLAGVFETSADPNVADELVCDATPEYSQQQRSYSARFSTSCIGGPPSFRWAVDMTYEDYDTEVQSLDSAPDVNWAGPVANDAYAPCVPGAVSAPGAASDGFVPLVPARLLDTRTGQPTIDCAFVGGGRVGGTSVQLVVAGRGGVPADARAVVLNLTATDATAAGYVTAFPCGGGIPLASNVNFVARETRANAAIVEVGVGGAVCIFSNVPAHLVADVTGFFTASASFEPIGPERRYDSRNLSSTPLPGGSVVSLGLPIGAHDAAVLNVTVVGDTAAGYATVYPCGSPPTASNVNFRGGEAAANLVVATTTASATTCIFISAAAHVIVDLLGRFPSTAGFTAVPPARLLETRSGLSTVDGAANDIGLRVGPSVTTLQVNGRGQVPSTASAVVLNVTVDDARGPGFITVFPCDRPQPLASSVNYVLGSTVPNAVFTKVAADGTVCFYSNASTHLIVDVNGYFPVADT